MAAKNHIELVEKTMRVLEIIGAEEGGMALADLAVSTGLVKSSVFRILFTLIELGYVEKAPGNGTYVATLKLSALGRAAGVRAGLITIAETHLRQARDRLGESSWLAELRDGHLVLTTVAEATHPLRLAFRVGDRCPWHASALGKAVAAHLPRRQLAAALGSGRLPQFTEHTISSRRQLASELALVRRRGHAANQEETISGALAYGAPVFDAAGAVIAAVSITAPTARCNGAKREAMTAEVKGLAQAITQDAARLAFRAPTDGVLAGRPT